MANSFHAWTIPVYKICRFVDGYLLCVVCRVLPRLVEAAEILSRGGVGVIPTDTCYTFACDILSRKGIERVRPCCLRHSFT